MDQVSRDQAQQQQNRAWNIQKSFKLRKWDRITDSKELITQGAAHTPLGFLRTRYKENTEHTGKDAERHFNK